MQNISDFRLEPQPALIPDTPLLVEKEILFQKPHRQEFIQTHAEQFPAHVIRWNQDGNFYLVHPALQAELELETRLVLLTPYIDRQGSVALWPISTYPSSWQSSAQAIVEQGRSTWLRAIPNMAKEAYDALPAKGGLGAPPWPDQSLEALIAEAFGDRLITSLDHVVVRALRGEAEHV